MKFSKIFLILFLSVLSLQAQTTFVKRDSISQEIKSLVKKNIDSVNKDLQIAELKYHVSCAKETIATQNSTISNFGVYATVFATLLSILMAIVTYIGGIRPFRDKEKELENIKDELQEKLNNFDNMVENYLSKNRDKQIDWALENIESSEESTQKKALFFLESSYLQGFSESQRDKIYLLLQRHITNNKKIYYYGVGAYGYADSLIDFIMVYKNEQADLFFQGNFKRCSKKACEYFSKSSFLNYIDFIIDYFNSLDEGERANSYFHSLVFNIVGLLSVDELKAIFNHKKLNDVLEPDLANLNIINEAHNYNIRGGVEKLEIAFQGSDLQKRIEIINSVSTSEE